jgi:Pyridoxamine 5'-phosphate oxidase like
VTCGLDTERLSLIKVHVDSAEYWESTSSKVRQLIGAARAAATGDPDEFPVTNRSVNL